MVPPAVSWRGIISSKRLIWKIWGTIVSHTNDTVCTLSVASPWIHQPKPVHNLMHRSQCLVHCVIQQAPRLGHPLDSSVGTGAGSMPLRDSAVPWHERSGSTRDSAAPCGSGSTCDSAAPFCKRFWTHFGGLPAECLWVPYQKYPTGSSEGQKQISCCVQLGDA